jgi:hypothetical protein
VGVVAVVVVVVAIFAVLLRPPISNPALAHELIGMERESREAQVFFGGPPGQIQLGDLSAALRDRVSDSTEIHKRHTARLVEIMAKHGWPTEKAVGREGAFAAMNILRRSDGDSAFFTNALSLIARAGADDTPEYAQLVDRIAVTSDQPQTYGTQWTCRNGEVSPQTPIKDRANLDARRRRVGLPPYATDVGNGGKFAFCGDVSGEAPVTIQPRD